MEEIRFNTEDEDKLLRAEAVEQTASDLLLAVWSAIQRGAIPERGTVADSALRLRDALNPYWPNQPDWLPGQPRCVAVVERHGKQYTLSAGISDEHVDALIRLSCEDPEIRRWTPRDHAERFTDRTAFERWQQKGRSIYALTDGPNLAGVIWLGPDPCPAKDFPHDQTFAIRVYSDYQGTGLVFPFMRRTLEDYAAQHPDMRGVWLEVLKDNRRAEAVYKRFQFERVMEGETCYVMVQRQAGSFLTS